MAIRNALLLFYFTILTFSVASAQNDIGADTSVSKKNSSSVNDASAKLLKSIKESKGDEEITSNYFSLAQELKLSGDFSKAELYMNKAIQLELKSKTKKNLSEYYRELAKIQELQNKYELASESYDKAAELTSDNAQKQLNKNDADRLKHKSSPKLEIEYLNQNSAILTNSSNRQEKLQNYTQLANANKALNQNDKAIENYKEALNSVDSNSENSVLIKSDIANLMAANNDYENAIGLQKEVVNEAQQNSSVATQVKQLRNLSDLYFTTDSIAAGLAALQDAYKLAIAKGNLKEAKASLIALATYYEKYKENREVIKLYRDFIGQLEPLISKDSSLVDKSLFLINEGKIYELEQQQALKDELIQRKNRYNYVLAGSVILLLALLLLIVKAWLSIKKRNKQIALQSLRREMNPHFIFNSLNSVNQFIANNNEREANKYLTSYSNLMRAMMENSNKDYITLSAEIEQLKKYLELEKLRFTDKFEYQIEIDSAINEDETMVPNMIIQPNLENAIWHGLRYKESIGFLKLKFSRVGDRTVVTVDDNGIGLQESKNIKTKNQKMQESLGLKNVEERIRLLNDIYKSDIRFEIKEKSEGGVLVKIEW
ncbi:MAG: histidine kinase [Bacteroidia bacterium]